MALAAVVVYLVALGLALRWWAGAPRTWGGTPLDAETPPNARGAGGAEGIGLHLGGPCADAPNLYHGPPEDARPMPMNPLPELSAREAELVHAIARRAVAWNVKGPTLHVAMDVAAVHVTTPLRLQELRDAAIDNLVHDVEGIRRHLDRETGQLDKRPDRDPEDGRAPAPLFEPRYTGGERIR